MTKAMKLVGAVLGLLLWGAAQAGTVTYVYTDPQGTPLMETDAQGNITARYEYTPYGVPVASVGAAPDGVGYTGHVNDPETGLVYMQARYYDPATGRFLSADPVTPSAGNTFNFNRYDYTSNNPVNHIDPDGRCVDGLNCGVPNPTQPTTSPQPTTQPQPTATPEPRKSSSTLRRLWEKMTGEKWPKDPATGRNQDVAHKDAVGDGGSPNDPQNYEPKPHDQHMQEHKDNGDFKRWGARSGNAPKPAGSGPANETPQVTPEPPVVEPPVVEPPIVEPPVIFEPLIP